MTSFVLKWFDEKVHGFIILYMSNLNLLELNQWEKKWKQDTANSYD